MDHESLHQLKQVSIVLGNLRNLQYINVLWRAQLGLSLQEDNNASMSKAMLLKLMVYI